MRESEVFIESAVDSWSYPVEPPFCPDADYPEFAGRLRLGPERNHVYRTFRNLLKRMAPDENGSDRAWNPLGSWVHPGDNVVIKPNLVRHFHLAGGDIFSVITHPSLVRCALDYVALALDGRGSIVVGDAPVQGADFPEILARTHLEEIAEEVTAAWGIPVHIRDWRRTVFKGRGALGERILEKRESAHAWVDVADASSLSPLDATSDRFRVTCYDPNAMNAHHRPGLHRYLISKDVLDADVLISLPKLKTHRKAGMTCALKNLVGINCTKDCLPHHRQGSVQDGGDEYLEPSAIRRLQGTLQAVVDRNTRSPLLPLARLGIRVLNRCRNKAKPGDHYMEGNWYGNDTVWRMVLDLNRICRYADREGRLATTPQLRCLTFVDALISGEGEGPMQPDAVATGFLAGGISGLAVDAVLATAVGFDYRKIPLIANGFTTGVSYFASFRASDVAVISNDARFRGMEIGEGPPVFRFKPASGWIGAIELENQPVE